MRQRLRSFRRTVLWRLLCGAMGGVAVAGQIRAADTPGNTGGVSAEPPPLRLSLTLGSTRKPERRPSPVRVSGPTEQAMPLRMTLTLVSRSGDGPQGPGNPPSRAAVLAAAISGTRAGGGERIGVTAGGPANGLQDEAADEQPAPSGGSAAEPASATTTRQPSPVARDAASAAQTDATALPDLEGMNWQLAPIRWTGNTGTQVNSFIGEGGESITGITNIMNVSADSFIVAPWLGKWNAGFGRITGNVTSSGTQAKVKSENEAHYVSGSVALLPVSKFPFNATFNHSWSDAKIGRRAGGLGNGRGDASATQYTLEQKYRSGPDSYSVEYRGGSLRTGDEENNFSSLRGTYSTRHEFDYEHILGGVHSLSANVNYVPEVTANNGKSNVIGGNITHNWSVHEDLSINNRLVLSNNSLESLQGNALQRNDSTYLLGASDFFWRPFEDEPLTVQGGATYWTVQTDVSDTRFGGPIEQDNFSANVNGTYTFNKNLSANASLSAASTSSTEAGSSASSGPSRVNIVNGRVGANYYGDLRQIGSYLYNWNVGGGLGSWFNNRGTSSIDATGAGNHSVTRTIVIDPKQSLGLTASQNISLSTSSEYGLTTSLTHGAGGNWNANYGSGLSAALSGTVSHSLFSDDISSNVQSLNMSATATLSYSRQVSQRADLRVAGALSWSRYYSGSVQSQTLNQLKIDSSQDTYAGNLIASYNHTAPFSVPNLHYSANLFVNVFSGASGVVGYPTLGSLGNGSNVSPARLNTSTTLQQNLRYRIGRLSFNANAAVIHTDGGTNFSVFGSMNREFKGFFDGRW